MYSPEKNHQLQLAAYAAFRQRCADAKSTPKVKFVMIGGTRVDQPKDQAIVDALHAQIVALGMQDDVTIRTNISVQELQSWLAKARAGIHTMANEHFGISVVELMAAGVIPIVHNSGGPRKDIVIPWTLAHDATPSRTGYLAVDEASYADALSHVFGAAADEAALNNLQDAARASVVTRFSDETFTIDFLRTMRRQLLCIRQVLGDPAD
jgi:alpha-1,2-mannosyltransferase